MVLRYAGAKAMQPVEGDLLEFSFAAVWSLQTAGRQNYRALLQQDIVQEFDHLRTSRVAGIGAPFCWRSLSNLEVLINEEISKMVRC